MLSIFVAHVDYTTLITIFMILRRPCLDPKSFTQSSLKLAGNLSSAFHMLKESPVINKMGHQLRVPNDCESSCIPRAPTSVTKVPSTNSLDFALNMPLSPA